MGLGQVRANVLCSILPMTSAERETHLHFMEARSEVKRGKVTLPLMFTTGPEVGWDLNSKLLWRGPGNGHCEGRVVGGIRMQKGASFEPCAQSPWTSPQAVEWCVYGDLMGQERQFQHRRSRGTVWSVSSKHQLWCQNQGPPSRFLAV